jgi:hypothetical protein
MSRTWFAPSRRCLDIQSCTITQSRRHSRASLPRRQHYGARALSRDAGYQSRDAGYQRSPADARLAPPAVAAQMLTSELPEQSRHAPPDPFGPRRARARHSPPYLSIKTEKTGRSSAFNSFGYLSNACPFASSVSCASPNFREGTGFQDAQCRGADESAELDARDKLPFPRCLNFGLAALP